MSAWGYSYDYRTSEAFSGWQEIQDPKGETGEKAVMIKFKVPHKYGNNIPFSDAKHLAAQLLNKPYSRMRVIDLEFDKTVEGVVGYTVAYRK